jgi:hypothetical protein
VRDVNRVSGALSQTAGNVFSQPDFIFDKKNPHVPTPPQKIYSSAHEAKLNPHATHHYGTGIPVVTIAFEGL